MLADVILRPACAGDCAALSELYTGSFPPEERRLWQALWAPSRSGEPALLAIEAGGALCGMLSWWNLPSAVYVEHFAIDPVRRGGGTGSSAMRMFLSNIAGGRPVILEVEQPSEADPVTIRRVEFYRRLGFHLLAHEYMQPPYAAGMPPVPMCLMSTNRNMPAQPLISELHGMVYGLRV